MDFFTSVLVPVIIGWFIYLLSLSRFASLTQGYQISMILAFVLLIGSGISIQKLTFPIPPNLTLGLHKLTKHWQAVRVLMISLGISEGILFFFPTLLILTRLGQEQILGTISGASALFTGVFLYSYGRKAERKHRNPFFIGSLLLTIVAALFAVPDNHIFLLCYLALENLAIIFLWLGVEPHIMDIVDEQVLAGHYHRYALIVDRELFLNIGRIISIAVFTGLYVFNQAAGLHWAPLLTTVLSAVLVCSLWNDFTSR